MAIIRFAMKSLVLVCLIFAAAGHGWAQGYPAKPVRYLVAFSAGSGADTLGRIVGGALAEAFGQQVVVENRTGAAGNIAAELAANAPADGYLIFQASLTHAVNATLYRNLSYDLVRDFAAATQLASAPMLVVVHPSLPVKSIGELARLAKARPGAINYASAGIGSATFLAAEMFKAAAGADLMHVPYRGGGEAIIAVMTGESTVQFGPLASWLPHVRQGRGRALAVTSSKRLPFLADYPTVAETFPGYEAGNWYGLVVPAKTPKEIVSAIRTAVAAALNKPAVNKRLADLGYVVIGDQPDEFAAHIRSEVDKLGNVIRRLGVTVN